MTPLPSAAQAAFEEQAVHCGNLGSPFTARLMRLCAARLDADTPLGARVAAWPGPIGPRAASVPLRLAGALHALVLEGDPLAAAWPPAKADDDTVWAAALYAMARREGDLLRWMESPPQTNEVRRAAGLIGAAHWLAARFPGLPFNLLELGASAGLNLMFDRFALLAGGARRGAATPALTLTPDWRGPAPPAAPFAVASRRGADLGPVDPHSALGALRLRAYIWADQFDRRALTDAAIAVASAPVDRADAGEWLAQRLGAGSFPADGRLTFVFHTIAWQYFPETTRAAITSTLAEAGRRASSVAPLARVSMEPDGEARGAALTLTLWPGGETILLGRVDFHGRWVDWLARAPG